MGNVKTDKERDRLKEEEITREGNPACPEGEAGLQMLRRMNGTHYDVSGWAMDMMDLDKDLSVLDIGCGGGLTLERIAGRVPGGKFAGLDISEVSVKETGLRNKDLVDQGRLEVVQGSVESLPYKDASFDRIITVESFYFWPDPASNLKEVCRVLKKGGRFFLVADIYNNGRLSQEALANIKRYKLFNPTREEFESLLEQAGFSEVTIHTKEGTDWICAEGKA